MLELVISGGQTGADITGVMVAQSFGIKTSGWLPKGWRTLDGPKPEYAKLYGMKEHSSSGYKERTWDNVLWADGTMRFASNLSSPGEKCTLNAIKAHGKPHFDVEFDAWSGRLKDWKAPDSRMHYLAAKWIEDNNIKILNIAGNSHQTYIGIEGSTRMFLTYMFRMLGYEYDISSARS